MRTSSRIVWAVEAGAGVLEACIAAARCAPEECLYVDDRADFVAAGGSLGLRGLVYTPGVDVLSATCY